MRTTIMEYGLMIVAVVLIMSILSTFGDMISDTGDIKETLMDYVNSIC